VITLLSVLGVTLGVTVLIVVLSVMEGFEKELRDKVIGFNAHLTITNGDILADPAATLAALREEPEILDAAAFISGPVMAQFGGRVSTPIIRGVPEGRDDSVVPLQRKIAFGEYDLSGNTLLVGEEWARRNGAMVGDKILLYGPRHFDSLRLNYEAQQKGAAEEAPAVAVLPNEYIISGIFATGMQEYDLNFFIISLLNAQRLYKLEDGVHGVQVRVKDPDPTSVFPLVKRLNERFQRPLVARSWMDQNRPLFNAIATERVVMSFILLFIMIVAAFGLCSTLITITVQKGREIGVLKAMGARDGQIRWIFALHGLIVGALGAVIGTGLGLTVLAFRNSARDFLDSSFDVDVFSAEIYEFPNIPAVIDPVTVALIALTAVAICVLAALIPAQTAARLDPARALRYE
jgi:lipoprotein-releasing system permease protein